MLKLYCTKEAAAILKMSARTLERYRVLGEGPKFAKLGKTVRYQEQDIVDWVASKCRKSTSQKATIEACNFRSLRRAVYDEVIVCRMPNDVLARAA